MEVLTKSPNGLSVAVKPSELAESLKQNAAATGSPTIKMIADDYVKNMDSDLELIRRSK